jgi:hypothetical protein
MRFIHERFQAKMAENPHGYCVCTLVSFASSLLPSAAQGKFESKL